MDPEQTDLGPHCLPERLLKHFSRQEKADDFVAIGTLRANNCSDCSYRRGLICVYTVCSGLSVKILTLKATSKNASENVVC